jgi:hypothetical protein
MREQTGRRSCYRLIGSRCQRLRRFDCDFYAAQNKHTHTSEDSFMPVLRKVHNRVLKNRDCYLPVSAAWTFFRLSMFFCKPVT